MRANNNNREQNTLERAEFRFYIVVNFKLKIYMLVVRYHPWHLLYYPKSKLGYS